LGLPVRSGLTKYTLMKLYRLCAAAAVTVFALFCAGAASADPKGLWLAQDGARVKVGPCGGALCATIAAPKSAYDPETGRPWTDKNNPDPAQRGRPLVGVPVLYGLVPEGPGRWSGRLHNVTVMRDVSSSLAPRRSASKVARSASAAART
jgi:uncharacterized protein (DUF2147 family)